MTSRLSSFAVAGALAGGLSCAGPAAADVTAALIDANTYSYSISHVPDFDQRRLLIPNAGAAYCVPTSSMNWMAYFANHGAGWLAPGPGNWESPDRHLDGTNAIILLGDFMSTHEINGTNSTGAWNGLHAWLFPPFLFSVAQQLPSSNWTPGFHQASMAVMNGGYCMVGVGWYQEYVFDPDYIERQGGHELTLTGGARTGSAMQLSWRDPAADEGMGNPLRLLLQSPFTTHNYAIDRVWRYSAGVGGNHRWMDKVVGYAGNLQGYIDSVISIRPNFALASQPDSDQFVIGPTLYPIFGGVVDEVQEFEIGPAGAIFDFNLNPDLCSAVYVVEQSGGPREVRWLDLATQESKPIGWPFDGPRAAFVCPDRALFVLEGSDRVLRVNLDLAALDVEAMVDAPCAVDAMAYDDATDEVVLFSASCQTIYRYPRTLSGPPQVLPIVPMFPVEPDDARMAFDPRSGNVWVCSGASNSLYELVEFIPGHELMPEELSLASIVNPKALAFGNTGRLFVSNQGKVDEYDYLPDEDRWIAAEDPLFLGFAADRFLCVSRSSSNFDPELHVGPDYYNVLPDEDGDAGTPDCVTDLDGDGQTGFSDLVAVLAAWGPCPAGAFCHPDFDYSGDVGFDDLLTVLSAWGPCP